MRLPSLCFTEIYLAGVEGLEPPTPGFGDRCSSQLSYTPTQSVCGGPKARRQRDMPEGLAVCKSCALPAPSAVPV